MKRRNQFQPESEGVVLLDLTSHKNLTRFVRNGLELDIKDNEHAYKMFKNKRCYTDDGELCPKIINNSIGEVSRFRNYSGIGEKIIKYPIYRVVTDSCPFMYKGPMHL